MSAGIDSLKGVIVAAAAIVTDGADAMADKKLSFDDYKAVWDMIGQINSAAPLFSKVPAELTDLDEAEMNEIVEAVKEKIGSDHVKAKEVAGHALKFVYHGYMTFVTARS